MEDFDLDDIWEMMRHSCYHNQENKDAFVDSHHGLPEQILAAALLPVFEEHVGWDQQGTFLEVKCYRMLHWLREKAKS